MSKINFLALTPPSVKQETRELTDPAQPGLVVALTLRSLDTAEQHEAVTLGDQITKDFYGEPENGIKATKAMPPVGGRAVIVTPTFCYTIAQMMCQQVLDKPEDRYEFEQWAAMAIAMPTVFREVVAWSTELNKAGRLKNDSPADTVPLSPLVSES